MGTNNEMALVQSLIHDLCNKITIAQGNIHKLNREPSLLDNPQLSAVTIALGRAVELLQALKDCSRVGKRSIDVETTIDSMGVFFEKLEKMYGVSIELDLQTARSGAHVDIDMAKMARVVENIVENASKAGATKLLIRDRVEGNMVCSEFSDNGGGCKNEGLIKIGTGWTTGGSGKGTQIIRELIESMGGSVTWTHNPTGGMVVTTYLHLSNHEQAA